MNTLRIAALAVAAAATLCAAAEGYQVNTLSARQNGMGHTGTALRLGAESQIFNPAGLTGIKKTVEFQGSVTAIFAHATANVEGTEYHTSNTASTPMAFNLGMKVYDNLAAGVSFYTPAGSGITWGDNWPGAVLNQSVTLKAFTVQPTLAWEIIPGLSVGAGAMISFGTVDLDKGLVTPGSLNALLAMAGQDYRFTDTPASINLAGRTATTVGFNVGALWQIDRRWSVGVSYRSRMRLTVKSGDASLRYANEIARTLLQERLNVLDEANFTASMPVPAVLAFGAAFRPNERLTLAADAQLNFWKTYRHLDIEFLSQALTPYNQHLVKNYHNAWTVRLGAQYSLTKRLDLRAGVMLDTTPVSAEHYNPETPGMTKINPSVGFSFSPVEWLAVDASLVYVAGLGKDDASCSYADLLTGGTATFTANYSSHAWCPAIGFRLAF